MTIPNLITSLRIILVPIFVIYILNDEFLPAMVIFGLAGLSDGADGLIARVFEQKSRLGSFLDPLADKMLLVAGFIVLSVRELVPSWLTVLVISRDAFILLGVLVLFLHKMDLTIRPSVVSKITTCFQLTSLFIVLLNREVSFSARYCEVVFYITGFLTIASGLHYMHYWFKMIGEGTSEDQD